MHQKKGLLYMGFVHVFIFVLIHFDSVWLVKHTHQALTTWSKCEELILFSVMCTAAFKPSTLLLDTIPLILQEMCFCCISKKQGAFSHLSLFSQKNINPVSVSDTADAFWTQTQTEILFHLHKLKNRTGKYARSSNDRNT